MNTTSLFDQDSVRQSRIKIAVFRALQLGDLICAEPAFRALRKTLPNAHITLIGLPWSKAYVEIYDSIFDDWIEFPGYPGLPERGFDVKQFASFLKRIHEQNFDVVLQMHGSGLITNPLISLFGAKHVAGFFLKGQFCPNSKNFLPHEDGIHEIWRHLSLMKFLGARIDDEEPRWIVKREHQNELQFLFERHRFDPTRPYICLHPGARADFRCWSPENFAAVGDELAQRGFQIVVTGTKAESERASQVQKNMHHRALNLAGETSLASMGALIAGARLLVCNDTGVSHLAVALNRPSVVVFTRSEFLGWPPLNRTRHRVVSRLRGVEIEDVVKEIDDLILATESTSMIKDAEGKETFVYASPENINMAYTR